MKNMRKSKNDSPSTDNNTLAAIHDDFKFAGARTIRKLRKMKGISQGEAALLADISQSYLSNVEHARHVLSIPKLYLFSIRINIKPQYFFNMLLDEANYVRSRKEIFEDQRSDYLEYTDFEDYIRSNLYIDL